MDLMVVYLSSHLQLLVPSGAPGAHRPIFGSEYQAVIFANKKNDDNKKIKKKKLKSNLNQIKNKKTTTQISKIDVPPAPLQLLFLQVTLPADCNSGWQMSE